MSKPGGVRRRAGENRSPEGVPNDTYSVPPEVAEYFSIAVRMETTLGIISDMVKHGRGISKLGRTPTYKIVFRDQVLLAFKAMEMKAAADGTRRDPVGAAELYRATIGPVLQEFCTNGDVKKALDDIAIRANGMIGKLKEQDDGFKIPSADYFAVAENLVAGRLPFDDDSDREALTKFLALLLICRRVVDESQKQNNTAPFCMTQAMDPILWANDSEAVDAFREKGP